MTRTGDYRPARAARVIAADGGLLVLDTASERLFAYNETARQLWELMAEGRSAAALADELVERYGVPDTAARADVHAILENWRAHRLVLANGDREPAAHQAAAEQNSDPIVLAALSRCAKTFSCSLGGTAFRLAIEPPAVASALAMLLAPLAISGAAAAVELDVRSLHDGAMALAIDGREWLRSDDAGLVLGAIQQVMLEHLHPGVAWLAMAHGGAVARGGAALVVSAASGRGKTTLIAYLAAHGYDYLADDVIALSAPAGRVVPWPTPMSVKVGSRELLASYYGDLSRYPRMASARGELCLISPPGASWDVPPMPVRALLFPHYVPHAAPRLTRIEPFNALQRLLQDRVWLGHPMSEQRVRAFVEWIGTKPAYELVHGDVVAAARCVEDIL